MADTLADIVRRSRRAREPFIAAPVTTTAGGVDPLGLRQVNFDLMNEVFPGLNNVARHVRPFTVVAWAWRRTILLARKRGLALPLSAHEDFVARVEVAFLWSMLQGDGGGDVDLPGKQRVAAIWGEASLIAFGNAQWHDFVQARRNSTALTAAINYGPGLRAFGLLDDDAHQPGVRVHGAGTDAMLDAFEARMGPTLEHELFNGWDPCTLTRRKAARWRDRWDMDELSDEERSGVQDRLAGGVASASRRAGFALLREAVDGSAEIDEAEIRAAMCGDGGGIAPDRTLAWRRVQTRQAFRLALEGLLEWIVATLGPGTRSTADLARTLVGETGDTDAATAADWLALLRPDDPSPALALGELQSAFAAGSGVARAIMTAIAVCAAADAELHDGARQRDRLPLAAAVADVDGLGHASPQDLAAHVIERWVIAQHTYWSVGRGLADARAGAKRILRLRVVLEPSGWRVTRGGGSRSMPRATPDRLRTAISLALETGMVE